MTTSEIEDHLQAILSEVAPGASLAGINRKGNLREELDIDSMDFLRLIQGLDDRLQVNVPESDTGKVSTLDDLVAYIAARKP